MPPVNTVSVKFVMAQVMEDETSKATVSVLMNNNDGGGSETPSNPFGSNTWLVFDHVLA